MPMIPSAVVLADYAGTLDLSNRTEVRGRHTANAVPDTSLDLTDLATARLGLRDHRWNHGLGYTALLSAPDTQAGLSPQVMQMADVSTAWHDRLVRLGLAEYVSYGFTNTSYLFGGPPVPIVPTTPTTGPAIPTPVGPATPAPLTQPAVLKTASSRTVLTGAAQLSRRLTATSLLEYSTSGGVDDASRAFLPLLSGPRAEAIGTYRLTRLDGLETRVGAQRTTTTAGPCSPLLTNVPPGSVCSSSADTAQATEGWLRRLTRTSTATLAAGASLVHLRVRLEDPFITRAYPVVRASFVHDRLVEDVHAIVRVDAAVAPGIDLRTGTVDQRATAAVVLTLPISRVTLTGTFSGARTLYTLFAQPTTALQGAFDVEYRVDRHVGVGGGLRYGFLAQDGQPVIATSAAFVQATFRASQLHF
jgi:hypothetical protein